MPRTCQVSSRVASAAGTKKYPNVRLAAGQQTRRSVLGDGRLRRQPRGVTAPRAEPLSARHAISAGDHTRGRRRQRRVGDDAARRVDPDGPRGVARHASGVRREHRALADDPGGARVAEAKLADDPHVGRQIQLRAPQRPRQEQMKEPGVGEGREERSGQLAVGLDGGGAGADLGGELARRVDRERWHRSPMISSRRPGGGS